MNINIICQNHDFIIAEKPSGMPVQPDKTGDADLLSTLEEQFGSVWLLHRLDRPVGGLIMFALNEKTAAQISRQISNGTFQKNYYAVCCGVPQIQKGEMRDFLVKNQRLNLSEVSGKGNKNAKEAVLKYQLIGTVQQEGLGMLSLMDIQLLTGRHHQIRVQMSHAGLPLWGDVKYNPAFKRGYFGISPALYSYRVAFQNPVTGEAEIYEKNPEAEPFSLFFQK